MIRGGNSSFRGRLRMGSLLAILALLPALGGCPRSEDPAYYIKMLASKNEDVQRRGIEELARMQRKALPALKEALQSDDVNVRKNAVNVLAKVRRIDALTAAGPMIGDRDKDVSVAAIVTVSTLAQVWKNKSVELLTHGLDRDYAECVKKAAEGLRDMRHDEATAVLQERFQAGEGIQAVYAAKVLYETEPQDDTAQLLLRSLLARDSDVRDAAKECVTGLREDTDPMEGLRDKIVERLVVFIDTEKATARALMVLNNVRDTLIEELDKTLDSKRATVILHTLGVIADEESVEKLIADFRDARMESVWRVSAAQGMGVATLSDRCTPARKEKLTAELLQTVDNERQDNRVRIGAAIALCRLRQPKGVKYLLDELDRFQETVGKGAKLSEAKLRDFTRLRIRSQEALTASGDYVVDSLMERIRGADAGPTIIWAAAKTLGELNVEDAVPHLGPYTKARKKPVIAIGPQGKSAKSINLTDWENPDEEEVALLQAQLEEFKHPDYVRWTAAIALGKIGGPEAVSLLKEAEAAQTQFLDRLSKNSDHREFYKRAKVVNDLMRQHQDVLFYVRRALARAAAAG